MGEPLTLASDRKRGELAPPSPTRQIAFHQLLIAARRTWLLDRLREALEAADPVLVKAQLSEYVPADAQRTLAAAGIRDEYVFPVPTVIEAAPTLVGYYRLLLGAPQKTFYSGVTRLGPFKAMERSGTISERQRQALPSFCRAMCSVLADLVQQLSPTVTPRDIDELPLLTLGQQFQGANNVLIGQQAIQGVFQAIASVTADYVTERTEQALTVRNAAGRTVRIVLAADPDVRIEEEFAGNVRDKVALEIKGGTDKSNAHNRAGEAEKSHQKAKSLGFRDFWTIIAKRGLSLDTLRRESPTTNSWFDVAQVLAQQGDDWEEFKSRLVDAVGIPSA